MHAFPSADPSRAFSAFPFAIRSGNLFSFPMTSFYPLNAMKIKKETVSIAPLVSIILVNRREQQTSPSCRWAGVKVGGL